jgi:RNA polymerase sigma-70 factor, ECF subfamily
VDRAQIAQMADAELLERFNAGHVDAYEVLVRRYQRPLFNFILRSVGDRPTAEDLLQDAFARVIQGAADFRGSSKVTTWLYTIARNLCVDHSRRQKHRKHASLDAAVGHGDNEKTATLGDRIAVSTPDTERASAASTMAERIARAVERLPEDQREVFLMRHLQQLSYADIATVVEAPENTVKSRMRYALERLQEELADYAEEARALG